MFLRWKLLGKLSLRFLASLSRVVLEIFVLEAALLTKKKKKKKRKRKGRAPNRPEHQRYREKKTRNRRQLILRFVSCQFHTGTQWRRVEKLWYFVTLLKIYPGQVKIKIKIYFIGSFFYMYQVIRFINKERELKWCTV